VRTASDAIEVAKRQRSPPRKWTSCYAKLKPAAPQGR
jgi:hypothetical protein